MGSRFGERAREHWSASGQEGRVSCGQAALPAGCGIGAWRGVVCGEGEGAVAAGALSAAAIRNEKRLPASRAAWPWPTQAVTHTKRSTSPVVAKICGAINPLRRDLDSKRVLSLLKQQ